MSLTGQLLAAAAILDVQGRKDLADVIQSLIPQKEEAHVTAEDRVGEVPGD